MHAPEVVDPLPLALVSCLSRTWRLLGAFRASLTVYFHTVPPPLVKLTPSGPCAALESNTWMPPLVCLEVACGVSDWQRQV